MLTKSGVQKLYDESIAMLPDTVVGPDGSCCSPAYELVLPEVQLLLGFSIDALLHEKVRKRAVGLEAVCRVGL